MAIAPDPVLHFNWAPDSSHFQFELRLQKKCPAPVLPGSGLSVFRIQIFGEFFGFGAGLDIIFAQAGSGYGLSKTLRLEHFLFFHVLIFSCKHFLITWDLRDLMLDDGFMLLCNLPRAVDFAVHLTVVTCVAPTLIVYVYWLKPGRCRGRNKVKPGCFSRQARDQHSRSCRMCQSVNQNSVKFAVSQLQSIKIVCSVWDQEVQ